MNSEENYIEINRQSWNKRAEEHIHSEFYDVEGFLKGKSSLKDVELALLGDIKGKSVLHLQCHFGQDTLSLARMGAQVTGVDLSDTSIRMANDLASRAQLKGTFVCCNVYDTPQYVTEKFDIVFTTYGTVGWLPDMNKWAAVIANSLKPGGEFIFAEFHPVVWMFDNDFKEVGYNYFNVNPIVETESGTYTNREANITQQYVSWNHPISEVVNALVKNGLEIVALNEYDYSPWNCFKHTVEVEPGKFRIKHLEDKIPMVYAIKAVKKT